MIDPRISLAIQVPKASQAIQIFDQARQSQQQRAMNAQRMNQADIINPLLAQQAQQTVDANTQAAADADANRRIQSIAEFSPTLKPLLEQAMISGDTTSAQQALTQRFVQLQRDEKDTTETVEAITDLRNGNTQGVLSNLNAIDAQAQSRGLIGNGKRAFAPQQSAPITDPITGQVSTPVFDPNTQTTKLVPIEGAIQETPTQKSKREFDSAKAAADLEVSTTGRKEEIKKTAARTSELKTKYSTQRRQAAISQRRIGAAQKLTEKAAQGLGGVAIVQLGRLFPGIDASDEAALGGAFKSLALDELSKFSGPTTDFEFRVTEDIAGALGDGASANKARLASLSRAAWFASREAEQFVKHKNAGHDPDEFNFNINELITPKKGGKSYSLQDIQDTAVANHISIDEAIKRLSK